MGQKRSYKACFSVGMLVAEVLFVVLPVNSTTK
jgi:hypothetical protein